jgi:hypothetical protein
VNTLLPVTIIIGLGGLCALIAFRVTQHILIQSVAAALLATAIWVGGTVLLLWATAPNELGPPLPGPIFLTYLTALGPAVLTAWLTRVVWGGKG